MTYKNIIWLKKIKVTFCFNIKIITYWIDSGQLGLTSQIYYPSFETMITL